MTNKINQGFTDRNINELIECGKKMDVRVTVAHVPTSRTDNTYRRVVHIRDQEFYDFTKAALYLRHIDQNEIPERHQFLIG